MIFEEQPGLQVVKECCSLASIINNADKLVSLYYLPDCFKHRLSQLLCVSRRMNAHVFKLLLQGSPTEVCVKDCSWLTEEEFTKCLQNFDPSNLMVCSFIDWWCLPLFKTTNIFIKLKITNSFGDMTALLFSIALPYHIISLILFF